MGEKGALVDFGQSHSDGHFEVRGQLEGEAELRQAPFTGETHWALFYANIAGHLLHGEKLQVKPEQARRVIAIIEGAEKSHQVGHSVKLPTEDEDSLWKRSK